jgi:hypothetical protein
MVQFGYISGSYRIKVDFAMCEMGENRSFGQAIVFL